MVRVIPVSFAMDMLNRLDNLRSEDEEGLLLVSALQAKLLDFELGSFALLCYL